jgi:hypothetical protein
VGVSLVTAVFLSILEIVSIRSKSAYLSRFYARREELEELGGGVLSLRKSRKKGDKSGRTVRVLLGGFWVAIGTALVLISLALRDALVDQTAIAKNPSQQMPRSRSTTCSILQVVGHTREQSICINLWRQRLATRIRPPG